MIRNCNVARLTVEASGYSVSERQKPVNNLRELFKQSCFAASMQPQYVAPVWIDLVSVQPWGNSNESYSGRCGGGIYFDYGRKHGG
jgi:hypothetical protein